MFKAIILLTRREGATREELRSWWLADVGRRERLLVDEHPLVGDDGS